MNDWRKTIEIRRLKIYNKSARLMRTCLILKEKAAALKAQPFDRPAIAKRGLKYERLDQLTIEILTGVR
jgi:hypothetical protein